MNNNSLLSISNLQITINDKAIVKNLSLSIQENQFTTIIGESGSGKSITAKAIVQLNVDNDIKYQGSIIFNNQELLTFNDQQLSKIRGKKIGFVFQNPFTSLNPIHDIKRQIREAIEIHNPQLSKEELNNKTNQLLEMVDMSEFIDRNKVFPHQLSGGQQQRIAIAIAIANNPQLIIADEPTTSLDNETEKTIMQLLVKLHKKYRMAILLITHNIKIVQQFADIVYVMHKGKIIDSGDINHIENYTKNSYTKSLFENSKLKNNILPDIKNKQVILRVKNLNYQIQNRFFFIKNKNNKILSDINFILHKGETLGIIGKSGSGKSTLAQCLVGLKKASAENLEIYNKSIINNNFSKTDRKNIQIVLQDPFDNLNNFLSILSNIKEVMIAHNIFCNNEDMQYQMILNTLEELGLTEDILSKNPRNCSGGELQRLAVLRALILKPKIIILDEITSALDIINAQKLLKNLIEIQHKYKTSYIFISHNMNFVQQISHRVIAINSGRIK